MIRGVLFDFNGTLARLTSWGMPHQDVFVRHGLPEAGLRWGDRNDAGPADGEVHLAPSRSREEYHRWELDRLSARARRCGVPEDRLAALVADLDRETKTFTMARYDDVLGVLTELRRDYTIAVCSNWYWNLDEAIEQVGLAGVFETIVPSAQAGMRKPDPRIFRHTLRLSGLQPEEALYVGDLWVPDVEGPLAAGMRAIHLCRPDQAVAEDPPPLRPGVWRAADMAGVADLVGGLRC
ncbi:HAD family hydrolase [Amycolatopsis panacis]|uniref:HAD family hydrolase n=1 Tax=Amycolatopsis panacis TaxID=2340917 RepID=A0A419HJB0_9PSEU|nr:HAD family hydrolase [Amycolatopsis panacis]RJQ75896.1 HAD family hydrolase [Amycolatopsis panacis]